MIKQLALLPIYVLSCLNSPKTPQPAKQVEYSNNTLQIDKTNDITTLQVSAFGTLEDYGQEKNNHYWANYAKGQWQNENAIYTLEQYYQVAQNTEEEGINEIERVSQLTLITINATITTTFQLQSITTEFYDESEYAEYYVAASQVNDNNYPLVNMTTIDGIGQAYTKLNKTFIGQTQQTYFNQANEHGLIQPQHLQVVGGQTFTIAIYAELSPEMEWTKDRNARIMNTQVKLKTFVQPITVNTTVIDIPDLIFEILSIPFAFISQAFNLTLFPGTPYQINIANTLLVFIAILVFAAILKIVLKIFL